MGNFSDLARDLNRLARRIPKNINKTLKLTALAIDRELVLSTPVDTGRARSNWLVSTASLPRSVRPPFIEGMKLGINESANARGSLDHGKSVIKGLKEGEKIFISNNVEYIGRLNDGTSAQAPAGFIEAAIKRGEKAIDKLEIL